MESREEKRVPYRESTNKGRPKVLDGYTFEDRCGCGHMYITINVNERNHIQEIFPRLGKAGGCAMAQAECIGRLASLASRRGVKPEKLAEQICGVQCNRPPSCGEIIGRVIQKFVKKEE